jgi:NTP pyrophosphatase (non-canonical NTP hydrolase)
MRELIEKLPEPEIADDDDFFDFHDFGLDEYQEEAANFAFYSGITYPTLGLCGEAGELANHVKKLIRDSGMPADHDVQIDDQYMTEEMRSDLVLEAGDCLWYLANFCNDIGFSLSEVAEMNLEKLKRRKEKGTLTGSGDHR